MAAFVIGVVLTIAGWPGGVRPALAHEFSLALVTPTSGGSSAGVDGRDVIDGFRLAVDRSPDVSHPPGPDAGDHLGGVDVEVIVIDGTKSAETVEALSQQVATGLTAVVVIATEATSRAVVEELAGSPTLLVIAEGAGASAPSGAGGVTLTQRSAPRSEGGAAGDVAAAFEREHGRTMSAAAALGYDAARLLDVAVARADDGVEDLGSVVAAASGVEAELVSSDVSVPERATSGGGPVASGDPEPESAPGGLVAMVVGTGLVVALAAGWVGWRARTRRAHVG